MKEELRLETAAAEEQSEESKRRLRHVQWMAWVSRDESIEVFSCRQAHLCCIREKSQVVGNDRTVVYQSGPRGESTFWCPEE